MCMPVEGVPPLLFLELALSPNNNEIYIYQHHNGKWDRIYVLAEHDLPVTGIDWAPDTNRIVSCSQVKKSSM